MTDSISFVGLFTSLLLPWLLGGIWMYWLLCNTGRWNVFIIWGYGYLAGLFITTVVIRLWDLAGISLNFWGLATTILGLAVSGLIAIQLKTPNVVIAQRSHTLKQWQIAVITVLLVLIAYRYITIAQEIALRPLFPWDAWMYWTPKAIIWYSNNEITPIVDIATWFRQKDAAFQTLSRIYHPPTVSLIQLWVMLGARTSDHTLIYLPWLLVILSLGLAVYGHLRLSGSSILKATLACYVLLNIPFINVHTALAGYADIWLATAFGLATFALHEWKETRQWSYGILSVFFAIACTQLKNSGIVLGAIVFSVIAIYLVKFSFKTYLGLGLALIGALAYALVNGIHIDIPFLGTIVLTRELIQLPHIGTFPITYHPVHAAFLDALFNMFNWNLLWYLIALIAALKAMSAEFLSAPTPLLVSILFVMFFYTFVLNFTGYHLSAETFTRLNRALMYPVPSVVFYIFVTTTVRNIR